MTFTWQIALPISIKDFSIKTNRKDRAKERKIEQVKEVISSRERQQVKKQAPKYDRK